MAESDTAASDNVTTWLTRIEQAQRDARTYNERCKKIRKRFTQEGSGSAKRRRFQLLWANQLILRPACYAKRPSPVVTNRWKDGDQVARLTCELLERNLDLQFDLNDFDSAFKQVRNDYLLYGRGVPRLVYEPVFETAEIDDEAEDLDTKEDEDEAKKEPEQTLKIENLRLEFVQREDFIHPKSRTWRELPWVAYRAFLDRDELEKRFPKHAAEIELDARADGTDDGKNVQMADSHDDKATIYEIWDKREKRVLWIAKGYGEVLDDGAPYLAVDGFFPSPLPAFGTHATDSLEPVPDYVFYQDQAEEIDELTARIAALQDALKLVGFYPGGPAGEGEPEIELAMRPNIENRMIAVKSWSTFTEGGKNGAPIIWLPVDQVATIIKECVELRKQLVDDVYQITGISDILRGDTDAEETAAAQGIKAQWGSIRIRERQQELARVARDVTRMAAQIIAEHFDVSLLLEAANMKLPTEAENQQKIAAFQQAVEQWKAAQAAHAVSASIPPGAASPGAAPSPQPTNGGPSSPPPQPPELEPTVEAVERLLRDGVARRFLIDIEVDSTIAADEAAEKDARSKFVEAVSHFVVAWLPIVQGNPAMVDVAGQLLLFAVRAFPVGRELEEVIEQAMDKLREQAGQPKPPGPETLRAQAEMQKAHAEIEKAQIDMQAAAMKAKADVERTQMESQAALQSHQMEMQKMQLQAHIDSQKLGMQHAATLAEHDIKQKTLAQQMQMVEQKRVAQESMAALGPKEPV